MITFTKQELMAKAKQRPTGYTEDVLSMANVTGNILMLEDADWQALKMKYAGQMFAVTGLSMPAEKIKERFEICKTCEKATDRGFKCSLHNGCCFGRWRSNQENQCPLGRWTVLNKVKDKE